MADISTGRQRGIVPFVDETTGRLPDQYLPQLEIGGTNLIKGSKPYGKSGFFKNFKQCDRQRVRRTHIAIDHDIAIPSECIFGLF